MAGSEQPEPIWAASKARKQVDILKEVARFLAADESERASKPIGSMKAADLEAEQYRLAELLHRGNITVDDFRRLREIDFYLHDMRERRAHDGARQEWKPESLSD